MAKKILFIHQEIAPFVPETEMSLLGRQLPQMMSERGHETRTFMPKWGNVNERRGQLHEVIRLSGMNLIINETDHPLIIKVASVPASRVQVYFIDNDDYFSTWQPQADNKSADGIDTGERIVFFARGVLETVKKLRWTPDLIVCQGWMSALVPFYVKTAYRDEPSFKGIKVMTALWSKGPKRDMGKNFKQCVEFKSAKASLLKAYKDKFLSEDLARLAIDYSDALVDAPEGISEKLAAYAEETGLPMLPYTTDENLEVAYEDFIEGLF